MTTKHTPATPLPWSAFPKSWPYQYNHRTHVDRRYATHAANAYPRFVELVTDAIFDGRLQTFEDREKFRKAARALLHELGEE